MNGEHWEKGNNRLAATCRAYIGIFTSGEHETKNAAPSGVQHDGETAWRKYASFRTAINKRREQVPSFITG
jgi:hypothetical protein